MVFRAEAPGGVMCPGCSAKRVSHFLPCPAWLRAIAQTICDCFKGLSLMRATVETVLLVIERAHNLTVMQNMHSQET